MAPAWLTLRADLRLRWRSMLGMVLLVGLVSGAVQQAPRPAGCSPPSRPPAWHGAMAGRGISVLAVPRTDAYRWAPGRPYS